MTRRAFLAGLALWPALARAEDDAAALVAAARGQIGVTFLYDGSYQRLDYPGGDVPRLRGVCSDVVVRALRDGWGIDLQVAVHRDMKANFAAYPKIWGLKTTDRNIDHRRVPNLETLFRRIGAELPRSTDPAAFLPGDLVSWRLTGSNLPHIGIVDDRQGRGSAPPRMLHNIGWGARSDDMLFDHPITQHARLSGAARDRLARLAA